MDYEQEQSLVSEVRQYITDNVPLSRLSDSELEEEIEKAVIIMLGKNYCCIKQKISIARQVYSSIRGFGMLDSVLEDEDVTEIMINGPDNIFIERAGQLHRLDKKFESRQRLEDIIQKIVGLAGR